MLDENDGGAASRTIEHVEAVLPIVYVMTIQDDDLQAATRRPRRAGRADGGASRRSATSSTRDVCPATTTRSSSATGARMFVPGTDDWRGGSTAPSSTLSASGWCSRRDSIQPRRQSPRTDADARAHRSHAARSRSWASSPPPNADRQLGVRDDRYRARLQRCRTRRRVTYETVIVKADSVRPVPISRRPLPSRASRVLGADDAGEPQETFLIIQGVLGALGGDRDARRGAWHREHHDDVDLRAHPRDRHHEGRGRVEPSDQARLPRRSGHHRRAGRHRRPRLLGRQALRSRTCSCRVLIAAQAAGAGASVEATSFFQIPVVARASSQSPSRPAWVCSRACCPPFARQTSIR